MPVFLFIVFIALVLQAITFVPLLLIWSLNTLFALSLPYTWATWFATLVLAVALSGRKSIIPPRSPQ